MNVFQEVVDIIRLEIPEYRGGITRDTKIGEDLGQDSLDAVGLIVAVEENFGIDIPDDELPDVGGDPVETTGSTKDMTVGDLVNLVEKYLSE